MYSLPQQAGYAVVRRHAAPCWRGRHAKRLAGCRRWRRAMGPVSPRSHSQATLKELLKVGTARIGRRICWRQRVT